MIDPRTGYVIGALSAKGGVLTYHFDPKRNRIVGCWLNAKPIAHMPDIVDAIREDVAKEPRSCAG